MSQSVPVLYVFGGNRVLIAVHLAKDLLEKLSHTKLVHPTPPQWLTEIYVSGQTLTLTSSQKLAHNATHCNC